ncbi:MAG: PQQ-dependent sugar dehydrogenase [Myxococcota bacterium]|nr:PQQ-dependent sugar dehydrogenase [Myxococcota bacterium]
MFFTFILLGCQDAKQFVSEHYPQNYTVPVAQAKTSQVRLNRVASGFEQPTEIRFPAKHPDTMIVLEKKGKAYRITAGIDSPASKELFLSLDVRTGSEQGLLGLAFHPKYEKNGIFYIHSSPKKGPARGEISEWKVIDFNTWKSKRIRTVLEVEQPYANHNGGQLQFGPDGHLYIGLGDGGWRDDPHNHGQNGDTLLGSIVRIKPTPGAKEAYEVPEDNPFHEMEGWDSRIWVWGVRNPWRFSFSPKGELYVADVGQGKYEEVSVAKKGDNLGWKHREGKHCFPKESRCTDGDFVPPVFEYDHSLGNSITGGYHVTDGSVLSGSYIFGDFNSGRIWAMDSNYNATEISQAGLLISTFGRDVQGSVYLADFATGDIYRIES